MSDKARLLVVDDEPIVRDSLGKWFIEEGYEVGVAASADEAFKRMAEGRWDLGLVDIKMPGMDGLELERRLREIDPDMMIVMITGYASVETAVRALKDGAYDYVTKPCDPDDIAHLVRNALSHRRALQENVSLRETMVATARDQELVGQSPAMRRVFEAIETVGPTDATVLITGESGTGKELVARAIHAASPRHYSPLVVIHCGALTETLLESELFGYEKGAFTGALFRKRGNFETAHGGTIFLDEIGDVSLKTQTDLLRVLQEHEINRVGGTQPIRVNFRSVAATNKNLETLIEAGKFRLDLYYRLNVFRIDIPPLRERREDIPVLVSHFLRKFSLAMNKRIECVTPEAMELLNHYAWPGNIRELENAVERAMVVARQSELGREDFTLKPPSAEEELHALEDVARAHIFKVLEQCRGNQTRTAELLSINRVTLHNKLKKYGWKRTPGATG